MYLVVVAEAEIVGGCPRYVGDLKKDDQATKDCVRKSQRLILLHRYVTRQGKQDRSEERDAGASEALEKLVGYPCDYPWCLYTLFFSCWGFGSLLASYMYLYAYGNEGFQFHNRGSFGRLMHLFPEL